MKQKNSMKSNTRTIKVENSIIIYTLALDGIEDYLTYNETLLEILKQNRLKPFRDEGRLRFKVRVNHTDINIYLYDLAYACYINLINVDTFTDDIQRYYKDKSFQGLSIDHADGNIHNNTMFNLSAMSKRLNLSKNDIVSRVKQPICLNSAFVNGEYRVQMMFDTNEETMKYTILKNWYRTIVNHGGGYVYLNFICENAENYVKCLKWLVAQNYEWAESLKDNKGHWIKNDNNCLCSNIKNSLLVQDILSKMERGDFNIFE